MELDKAGQEELCGALVTAGIEEVDAAKIAAAAVGKVDPLKKRIWADNIAVQLAERISVDTVCDQYRQPSDRPGWSGGLPIPSRRIGFGN